MRIQKVFQYCPRCGTKSSKTAASLNCPECGLHFYFNPKPAQSVILKNSKDAYLFVIRALEPKKGSLDFPGGFAEDGEDLETTTRRELMEELGIEVGPLTYLSSNSDDYLFDGITYSVSGVTFLADLPPGAQLKPADDVADVEFYKLEDMPIDRFAWPSMHEMIDALKAKLSS